ncbi:hypothetical protein ACQPUI_02650 [Clostridium butyricum]|uniref:hypothetical protein n=1 Tax=Clostridium butyricum TaxID=1492 RepID=UPI003D339D3A
MNESTSFILEQFSNVLKNVDILEFMSEFKNMSETINKISEDTECLKNDSDHIKNKLDNILDKISELNKSISECKQLVRDTDEKIFFISKELDKIGENIDGQELEFYYDLCQSLYLDWDQMEELSRRLIPIGEYLYTKLQKCKCTDYSPVIIEFCRALENELLIKLFKKYTLDLIGRIGKDKLDDFLYKDKSDYYLCRKTSVFAKAILKSSKTDLPQYTLGQMNTILSLMNDYKVMDKSPLMKDFKKYLSQTMNINELLDKSFIDKIDNIVKNFRNPSAHPEFMELEKAAECKKIMPESIDYFLECMNI